MAPRKPRYRAEASQIEIERNPIERFILEGKDFVRRHRKPVVYGLCGAFAAGVIALGVIIAVDLVNTRNDARFEKIMNARMMSVIMSGGDASPAIKELRTFIDETYFGFSRSLAHYALGNIHYSRGEYVSAKENLLVFARREPKTILAPLAMLKASMALEESGDMKGALELYRQMEEKFGDGALADQIFYNYARVSGKANDLFNARKYYNRVISSYPESAYSSQARKRLFMLGSR